MRTLITVFRIFALPLALSVIIALAVRANGFRLFSIPSESMAPTLLNGDHVMAVPYDSLFRSCDPQRGDVVVFRRDGNFYVKRIVGLPGEVVDVRNSAVLINGLLLPEPYVARGEGSGLHAPVSVPHGEYFVAGDHRADSIDSRSWGTLPRGQIWGRARLIFWSDGTSTALNQPAIAQPASPSGPPDRAIRWERIGRRIR